MKFRRGKDSLMMLCLLYLFVSTATGFSSHKMPVLAYRVSSKGVTKEIVNGFDWKMGQDVFIYGSKVRALKMTSATTVAQVATTGAAITSPGILGKASLISGKLSTLGMSKMIHVSICMYIYTINQLSSND